MQRVPFSKNFEVHYYEIDRFQKCSPVALLNYLEETAISHSDSVGYGVDRLKSDKMGWILSRWTIKMDSMPGLSDKITIETWPSGFEKFLATREFVIRNESGKIIGLAASLWILFDIERRRPVRIPEQFGQNYGIDPVRCLDNPFTPLDFDMDGDPSNRFDVRRGDIDTNHHVNNAKYLEWLMESVPDSVYSGHELRSLEIYYKKEITGGAVACFADPPVYHKQETVELLHQITDGDGNTAASARTFWKKR